MLEYSGELGYKLFFVALRLDNPEDLELADSIGVC